MVRAMVTRETNGSYTVTMGDDVDMTTLKRNQEVVNVSAPVTTSASGNTSAVSSPLSSAAVSAEVTTEATKKEAVAKRLDNANKEFQKASEEVKIARGIAKINSSKQDEAKEAGKKVGRAKKELNAAKEAALALGIVTGGRHTKQTHRTRTRRVSHSKRKHSTRKRK